MPARRSDVTARRRGNLMRLLHGVYPERGHKRFFASLRMTKSEGFAMTLCVCQVIYDGHCNPLEGVKKLEESVERRYLQSFRIAAFDRHRSQGSASERE